MKKLTATIFAAVALTACGPRDGHILRPELSVGETGYFGEKIDTSSPLPADVFADRVMEGETFEATIKGQVLDVCKGEGCWLTLELDNGTQVTIYTEEEFLLPEDIHGRQAYAAGVSSLDTLTEDGNTQFEPSMVARGVVIK